MEDKKKVFPYYAQINFNIDVFPVRQDGSLDPDKLTAADLESYDITSSAVFGIEGFNIEDCINKVRTVLEGLKYE